MADVFSPAKRSEIMSLIRSTGNKETEETFAKILRLCRISGWRRGAAVFGKPDFVFRKARVAVFVDGCFWHYCPRHGIIPKARRKYWKPKILRNVERDREVNRELRRGGWKVLRIWSCELRDRRRLPRKLRRLHDMLNTT